MSERDRPRFMARLGNYLMTGLLVLAPTAITLWVFFRLLNWVDNLLGQFFRFAALDHRRIPGIGLVATLLLLIIVHVVLLAPFMLAGFLAWLEYRENQSFPRTRP